MADNAALVAENTTLKESLTSERELSAQVTESFKEYQAASEAQAVTLAAQAEQYKAESEAKDKKINSLTRKNKIMTVLSVLALGVGIGVAVN